MHERFTCTLEYFPGKGKKQNVWTKKWTDDDKIRKRIKFSEKPGTFIIKDSQFGKKANTHMKDYGLDISKSVDRNKFKDIINDIVNNHDEVIRGINWRSQLGYLIGYLKGEDVVLVNKDNVFITILKGGVNNARVKNARK